MPKIGKLCATGVIPMKRLSLRMPRLLATVIPLVLLTVILAGTSARPAQQDQFKFNPPDSNALAKANKTLGKMFKEDLATAKNDPAAARALAETLLREARQTNEDPPLRFAALALARDLAAQEADTGTALTAIEELAKHYVIDALAMKAKMLVLASEKAQSKDSHPAIVEAALGFLDEAMANDNYTVAGELVKAAEESATKSKNLQLVARVDKRTQEVEQAKKEFGRMQKFVDILDKAPDDPGANAEMGRYFCLVKGNWERGLPMLVKGQDKVFLDIAKRDLAKTQDTRAQLDLGDDYASLAEERKGLEQKMLLKRAHYWYVKCLPSLQSGLNKLRIEKAIEEIARLFPASPTVVVLSNAPINTLVRVFDKAHFNGVQVLAFSPDGKWVASGGVQESTVRLWQVSDGKQARQLTGHKDEIWGVAFSPDGTICGSASSDKSMRTWDATTGNSLQVYNGHTDWVRGVYFFPDKMRVLTAGDDKALRIWNLKDATVLKQIPAHTNFINSMSVSRDGRRAATGSVDQSVRVWDLGQGQEIAKFMHNQTVWAVAMSPDGKTVASATELSSTIKIWDVDNKKELRTLQLPARPWSLAFTPGGKVLAAGVGGLADNVPQEIIDGGWPLKGGFDYSIYLFDAETGKALRRLPGHNGNVRTLAFTNDGRYLASGGDDREIRLWGGEVKK
jgi:WD40 repeat protein